MLIASDLLVNDRTEPHAILDFGFPILDYVYIALRIKADFGKIFMPTYVYTSKSSGKQKNACDVCSANFEAVQHMSDDALVKCPQCGGAIERVIMAPNLSGAGSVKKPTDARMAKAGFTQYKRKGKGYYEKNFGQGPSALHG